MANNKVLQAIVEIAGSVSPTLQKAVEDTASKLDKVNLKAVAVGAACAVSAVAVGKAVVTGGKYLAELGDDYNKAMSNVSAATGAVGDELEALGDVVKTVYADNFGESMEAAAASVADVKKVLDLEGDALAKATENAIALSDTFEYEVSESTRTASALMKNFGIDAEEAYNLIAIGAQNGADQNGDLLDTLNEYAAQYSALGLSAGQFVQGLIEAGDAGVFSIDKVGDAVKEFNIRSKDLSDSSAEAYATLGMNADEMFQRFAAGGETANAAFFEVVNALESMEDPVAKNSAAVALFGTMYEDLGENILPILSSMEGVTLDNIDALEQINKVKYNDLGSALEGIKRQAEVALLPLATTVANSLMSLAPVVGDLFEAITPAIEGLTVALTPLINDLVAKVGPMLQELIPPLANIASSLLQKLIPPLVEIISSIVPVLIQLVQMLMPIVEFIAGEILPAVVDVLNAILPPVMQIISKVLPVVAQLLQRILPLLVQVIEVVLPVLIQLIETVLPPLMEIIDAVLPVVIQLLEMLMPIVTELISKVLPVVNKILGALLPILSKLITAIMPVVIELLNLLSPILDLIMALLSPILDLVVAVLNPILNLITAALDPLISVLTGLIQYALEPLKPLIEIVAELFEGVLGEALNAIMPIIEAAQKTFGGLIQFITGIFSGDWSSAWQGICDVFAGYWDYLKAIVKAPIVFIKNTVEKLGKAIGDVFKVAWDRIAKIWKKVGTFFSGIWEGVTKVFAKAWDGIKQVFAPVGDFFAGVWDKISGVFSVVVDWFRGIFQSVSDAIHTVVDPWVEIFRRVWEMIKEAFAPVVEFFSGVFTSAWNGIKTAFGTVGEFFLGVWNSIKSVFATVGSWFSSIFSGAWNGIKQAFSAASSFFSGVWNGIKGAFSAVTDWFRGVFSSAWQAVKDVFSTGGKIFEGMKDGILSAFKAVVNAIIKGINKVVSVPFNGINSVLKKLKGIEIVDIKPFDWISTLSVPQIPLLAAGGFTDGVSIAGEAGTEAVISFDPAYRDANIRTWTMAGKLLGVLDNIEMTDGAKAATAAAIQMIEVDNSRDEAPQITQAGKLMELDDFSLGQLTETTIIYYDFSGFTWSPQIEAGTGTDKQEIMEALKEHESEFFDWLEEWLRRKEVGKYDRVSIY